MLIESLVAQALATNCYVVAAEAGSECIVIDPGISIASEVEPLLTRLGLSPVAVFVTHGHLDHTQSAAAIADPRGIPVYIHAGDAGQLDDPLTGLSSDLVAFVRAMGMPMTTPKDVRTVADGETIEVAGIHLSVTHVPGHTPGSVFYGLDVDGVPHQFTGDVLFQGTIGRTDLPGGSSRQMTESLRGKVLPLPNETVILPGHGARSTIAAERQTNPFLVELTDGHGHSSAPTRGL